jgi:hypothetical protein
MYLPFVLLSNVPLDSTRIIAPQHLVACVSRLIGGILVFVFNFFRELHVMLATYHVQFDLYPRKLKG